MNIGYITVLIVIWGWAICATVSQGFADLKHDPVCENARAALDTVNAMNEMRKK